MSEVPSYDERLKQEVKSAVKHSIAALSEGHPGESMDGYALVTDDGLRTLGFLASTTEFTESQEESVRFEPVDWVYDDGVAAFDEPRKLLVASADAATTQDLHSTHVRTGFAALVAALSDLKSEGAFGDEVFLTVISTDPNELLERLEGEAVRTLNSTGLYQQWRASIE
jgi:hypothetical protein